MTRRAFAFAAFAAFIAPVAAAPVIGNCPIFPRDNYWNVPVTGLSPHGNSANIIATMGNTTRAHMDFGSGLCCQDPPEPDRYIGIPFVTVPGTQPKVPVVFDEPGESDPGPYPIPPNVPIEGDPFPDGTDSHVLVIDTTNCLLYETGASTRINNGASWTAFSGALFNLNSHAFRPDTFTSADAAGLPIFPGLVRYDEAATGYIGHALRMTTLPTRDTYIWPARHKASSNTGVNVPQMGMRLRLRPGVNINGLSPIAKTIAQALKTFGAIIADNGSDFYISGTPDARWDNDVLHELDFIRGTDWEVVDTTPMIVNINTGQVSTNVCNFAVDTDGDGMPDCVDRMQFRDPLVKDNDVYNVPRLFAMQQYRDFLGREGDEPGINFYVAGVSTGAIPVTQVIENFFLSPEFGGTVAPITRLYFAFFNRIPDYGGLQFQVNAFRTGTPLAVISNNFSLSPEFQATYGSLNNTQYVMLLYQNVLGRAAAQAEIDFHVNRLTTGATRGEVMVGFSESPEYQNLKFNAVYVTNMYVGMLRRAPEQGGFDFWVNYMATGNSGQALISGFFGGVEYHNRFLP